MQPLFGSETDGIQERKLVKRLLRKKKITFILTALCALIYLLQNIGFEEPIMDLFHGYSVARLNADWVLSIFYYSF